MTTNFDFLKKEKAFASFAEVARTAELLLHISVDECVICCRRAAEFAVRWMYSSDADLKIPGEDTLSRMISNRRFKEIVGSSVWKRIDYIRRVGNNAAHEGDRVTEEQAVLCLENLFVFLDQLAYFYSENYEKNVFDRSLLDLTPEEALSFVGGAAYKKPSVPEESRAVRSGLSARRADHQKTYLPDPLEKSDYSARMLYIDAMLQDAGWTKGKDWKDAPEAPDGRGHADYILFGRDGSPLAIIETRCTCTDPERGRARAGLYADGLEKKYGRRPVVFLSDGFETRIRDGIYPERKCAAFHSAGDLERMTSTLRERSDLKKVTVDRHIAGRYYQKAAVRSVCDALGEKKRRKALIVMASGSGKTRTSAALCDVLIKRGWVKNVLFLADRPPLATQAKRVFEKMLPGRPCADLSDPAADMSSDFVFASFGRMYDTVDSAEEGGERLFTCGRFDLVICDEAHMSIYGKYRDVINYFDAPLIGMTATPKEEIDPEIYEIFGLKKGFPTYTYDLRRAVREGFLADFVTADTGLRYDGGGTVYSKLSEEDRRVCEDTFITDSADPGDNGYSAGLEEWISDEKTIEEILRILMTRGSKSADGKPGKTVIFAGSHEHARKIYDVFCRIYPSPKGFAGIIDSRTEKLQKAIDDFSDPAKLPRIAISVDMLDTGIDVPEITNLVFMRKVVSKAKFRQMIGRGARICQGGNGISKRSFLVFDFCGNFEFFGMDRRGEDAGGLSGDLLGLQLKIVSRISAREHAGIRRAMTEEIAGKVSGLDRNAFDVRQHLKRVEKYSEPAGCDGLTPSETSAAAKELSPLFQNADKDPDSLRFERAVLELELALLSGKNGDVYLRRIKDLVSRMDTGNATAERRELAGRILSRAGAGDLDLAFLEKVRKELGAPAGEAGQTGTDD